MVRRERPHPDSARPSQVLEWFIVKLRRILLCLLAFLTASAGVASAIANAQGESTSASEKRARNSEAFVMYVNARGEVTCREATPDERRRIMERTGDTTVIYGGAPRRRTGTGEEDFSPLASTNSTLPALQPSAGLRIILHGTSQLEQNQDAKNAFIVAANRWEALISTPITVVLDVDFGPNFFGQPYPSANILGQTGTSRITSNVSNVRSRLLANSPTAAEQALYNALPTTVVPVEFSGATSSTASVRMARPNARALGLTPDITNPDSLTINQGDADIGFNSAFPFDFNPDDGIAAGQTDFDSVATHEMGHALGFLSESGGDNSTPVSVWDLFRFRPGITLSSFGSAARVMSAGGSQVFFDNQTNSFNSQELELSTGGPNGDATGGDHNQSSHWKADEQSGRYIGIMDPTLARGVRKTITDNDVKAMDAFGYSIGGTVPPPPPPDPAPANDNFANAVVLQGSSGTVTGTNVSATKETGEPSIAGNPGGKSVWFFWTAPATGTTTIDTVGSDYDTLLGIFNGGAVNVLATACAACENDDIDTPGKVFTSRVTFNAAAGVTYRIAVDGFNDGSGADAGGIQLNWTGPAGTPTPTPTPIPTPTPTPTPQITTVTGRIMENTQALQGVLVGFYGQNGVLLQQMTTASDGRWTFNASIGSLQHLLRQVGLLFQPAGPRLPHERGESGYGRRVGDEGQPD
jgi:hypothetical protein